ncbi:hypothetical protein HU200_060619 [Digitaria exilis]|uniref:E3 ubiquitin-protein ligase SHPRH first helical domain-containing protein n=1 Tax=Digitaria exilis TaxID=1010633 RepID=A0A835E1H9_9POAL|nr:hypothetical protein HU200_060619 [Digitaria exilis]
MIILFLVHVISNTEQLEGGLPDLVPQLRPIPTPCGTLDGSTGNISLQPEPSPPYVSGGILAAIFYSRHTRPRSLKVYIYEGARNLDLATIQKNDMTEICTADVVLTTYDVLKEDLSHDFDRHDGDCHFLRFQKRQTVKTFCVRLPSAKLIFYLVFADSNALLNVYLSNDDIAKLLVPLLKLRQACCHPQAGSSGLCSLQHNPLSMDEILQVLIAKAKIEGEEELRKIVFALNGLAGLAAIEQRNQKAISLYKEALALAHENIDDFRVDPLLNLHINYNLAELLRSSSSRSRYLQECPLKKQASEVDLSRKRKEIDIVETDTPAQKDFNASFTEVLNITKELQNEHMNWWLHALNCIEQNNVSADKLLEKIDNSSTKSTTGLGSRGMSSRSVYRHPSRTETTSRVIRNRSKTVLGKQYSTLAKKHLVLFEAMRKEFSQARFLSIAQNQLLRAHDEIKMSISRLQLREREMMNLVLSIL